MIVLITVVAISRILSRPHVDLMPENQGSAFYNLFGVQSIGCTIYWVYNPLYTKIVSPSLIVQTYSKIQTLCLYYAYTMQILSLTKVLPHTISTGIVTLMASIDLKILMALWLCVCYKQFLESLWYTVVMLYPNPFGFLKCVQRQSIIHQ